MTFMQRLVYGRLLSAMDQFPAWAKADLNLDSVENRTKRAKQIALNEC